MAARRIIYCGAFRMPEMDAAAQRVLGIARALEMTGRKVEFLAWNTPQSANRPQSTVDGFPFRVFAEMRGETGSPLSRARGYWRRGRGTMAYLESQDVSDVEAIICYNSNSGFIRALRSFCDRNRLKFLLDCTEWYDPSHLPGGLLGPVAVDEALRMRVFNLKADGLIAISRYIDHYYQARGMFTARVPSIIDCEAPKWRSTTVRRGWPDFSAEQPLRLCYAGNPGRKDRIDQIIAGVDKVNRQGIPVQLTLIGPDREQVAGLLGSNRRVIDSLGGRLEFTGRVPQDEVPALLCGCHFSILARPDARYAKAGFPTKLVESLASGLPVITTVTGDEGLYITEGREGFRAESCAAACLAEAIAKSASLRSSQWHEMITLARGAAKSNFDFRAYTGALEELLTRVTRNSRG